MAKCFVGAAGGLSAADMAVLIPENLRKDVVIFAGTPKEIVGTLTPPAPITVVKFTYPTGSVTSEPILLPPGNYRFIGFSYSDGGQGNNPNISMTGVSGFSPKKTSFYGYGDYFWGSIYDDVFSISEETEVRIKMSKVRGFYAAWATITASPVGP